MTWEILWALILGFALSGAVQAVISKAEMTRLLPDASPRSIAVACGLGAASSSCSYAAVALARSLFQKGAHFTAAMAFEFASTNLVIELGIIMAILLGWQFTLAEFAGGPLMIAILVLLFRLFLRRPLLEAARRQAERGLRGSMEGHAAMDMSVTEGGNVLQRALSPRGFTAISHCFVMDWAAIWKDVAGGLLIAGALGAWVPVEFWSAVMVASGLTVELVFGALGLIPAERHAIGAEAQITFNYTSVLTLIFLALAALLVWRAARTGVGAMLAEMDSPPRSRTEQVAD